ncbi:unnamed protein product [Fraxinus pennsylvanica]|uniref:Protein kinase domain-containing protein n=1 Tax=Fraxinus pennsylvanica TaxID=56036 RepID=A0AAD1ZYN9_9LAMI|nr:unnamed protein product [Fraxinus pennsylvanica]
MDQNLQAVFAAMASFFGVTLILFIILVICKSDSRRHRVNSSISRDRIRNRGQTRSITVPKTELSSISGGESATFDPNLNRISMQELILATRNFSPDLIIGDGSFGLVYKARLNSGTVVAVKKLAADAFQGFREFRAEMETLGKILHPNIVKMLGYCATGSDRVLIYEFIERGSLDQWLYDSSSSTADDGSEDEIRRIEQSHSHVSTQIAGTMGYMPPEYFHGTMATVMGDVYSFGVLMLEIVTGRRPSFPFAGEDGKEVRLMEWINKMVEQKKYMEMVDASISKDGLKENTVIEIFQIGLRCTNENAKLRPTMKEVGEELDKILASN